MAKYKGPKRRGNDTTGFGGWLKGHVGTVVTILLVLVSFIGSYSYNVYRLDTLEGQVKESKGGVDLAEVRKTLDIMFHSIKEDINRDFQALERLNKERWESQRRTNREVRNELRELNRRIR